MADLIAIGYPDETTASLASEEVKRLASELIIEPDAVAAIVRDKEGKYHVSTSHHPVGGGATWGMFWGLLFGLLFFVPVFGMAVGAGLAQIPALRDWSALVYLLLLPILRVSRVIHRRRRARFLPSAS